MLRNKGGMKKLIFAAAFLIAPAVAYGDPADDVSAERLRVDVEALVSFGTRHTLSSQNDPERGIGAALNWGNETFMTISSGCGGCLEIVMPETIIEGRRIPQPTRLRNVVAIKRGTERPNEVIIIQGHIDSRGSDVMDGEVEAPGANDNASGTALAIEAARVLSQEDHPVTLVFALLAGEEQGLYGGQLMADYAAAQGWQVKAVLNNDIVGGICGSDGYCDAEHVRVFSEGPRADLTDPLRAAQRREGGENDSPSRNLSRWIANLAAQNENGIAVRQIWRVDRMGRGGDQIPFLEKGYPAVRFSVAVEDYEHQHQDLRVDDGVAYGDTIDEMNFDYLAAVTRLNVQAAGLLARTPPPPVVEAEAAVRNDTLLTWKTVPGATTYEVKVRRSDESNWRDETPLGNDDVLWGAGVALGEEAAGIAEELVVPLRGDNWIFGIAACADGYCGPVASAVPAGAYAPVEPAVETD